MGFVVSQDRLEEIDEIAETVVVVAHHVYGRPQHVSETLHAPSLLLPRRLIGELRLEQYESALGLLFLCLGSISAPVHLNLSNGAEHVSDLACGKP